MRKQKALNELVDAVRDLHVVVSDGQGDSSPPVRIACSGEEFPWRLLRVRQALDEVDRASSSALQGGDPTESENQALRRALSALFLWMRENHLDEEEARNVAKEAVQKGSPKKRKKAYKPRPEWNPEGKYKKHFTVKGIPDCDDWTSMEEMRKYGQKLQDTNEILKQAGVRPDRKSEAKVADIVDPQPDPVVPGSFGRGR